VTPYPGTPLYNLAIEKGLLDGPEDFYEIKHMNSDLFTVNFMDISKEDAHLQLFHANKTLVGNYMDKHKEAQMRAARGMYFEGKPFRGFRSV
jgi:hypothetical protein